MLLTHVCSTDRYYVLWVHNTCFISVRIYIWAIAGCVYFVNILVYAFNRHLKCACYIKHIYIHKIMYVQRTLCIKLFMLSDII